MAYKFTWIPSHSDGTTELPRHAEMRFHSPSYKCPSCGGFFVGDDARRHWAARCPRINGTMRYLGSLPR